MAANKLTFILPLAAAITALLIFDVGSVTASGLPNNFTHIAMEVSAKSYIATDKPYYQVGLQQDTIVKIYGSIPNLENGIVAITVKTPQDDFKRIDTNTDSYGSFSVPFLVGQKSYGGLYEVIGSYKGGEVVTSFLVSKDFVWQA